MTDNQELLSCLRACMAEIDSEIEQRKCSGNDEYWAGLQALYERSQAAIAASDHNCTDHSIPISRDATECLICRGRELAAEPDTLVAQLARRADEMEAIADTAGLRSSWYLEGAAALRKAARDNRRAVKALTAVAPGVRVPTDAQVNSACLSYRHDFGLLPDEQRKTVMFQAREWLHAWQKELPAALDTPAPAMGELVEAAKVAIDVMGRVDGANDCSRGINALEAALAKIGGAA